MLRVIIKSSLPVIMVAALVFAAAGCEPAQHEVSLEVKPEDAGEVTGEGMFSEGETVEIAAQAGECYEFVKWVEDGEELTTDKSYQFEADGDRSLEARFTGVTETVNGIEFECAEVVFDRDLDVDIAPGLPLDLLPVEEGILVSYEQDLFLKDEDTGEPIWSLENHSPIVEEGAVPRFAPVFRENEKMVVPMFDYDYDYDDEKFTDEYERVPVLAKLNFATGEITWSHPLARNTPPLMVFELWLKDGHLIAEGNFDTGVDRDVPPSGVHAGSVAAHDYETGALIHAHSGFYGGIEAVDNSLFYSHVEYEPPDNGDPEVPEIFFGKKDLLTGEEAWEIREEESDEVIGLSTAGDISWRVPGKIVDSGELISLSGLPVLPEAVLLEDTVSEDDAANTGETILTGRGLGTDNAAVELVGVEEGEVIESYPVPEAVENVEAFLYEGYYYLFTGDAAEEEVRIRAVDVVTGETKWTDQLHLLQSELSPERAVMMMDRLYSETEELINLSGHVPVMSPEHNLKFVDPASGEEKAAFDGILNVLFSEDDIYLVGETSFKVVCPDELTVIREKALEEVFFDEEVEAIEIAVRLESEQAAFITAPDQFAVIEKEEGKLFYRCRHEDYVLSGIMEEGRALLHQEGRVILLGPKH